MADEDKKKDAAAEDKQAADKQSQDKAAADKAEAKQDDAQPEADTSDADDKKEVEVPKKFKSIVEEIEKMSVLELSELVEILEDKFGVSSAAPVMAAAGPAAGGEAAAEEKSEFDVELTGAGDSKINVIKAIRELTQLGLKEAKDMVDSAPTVIKEAVKKEDAEEMKAKLEEAGGQVTLK